MKDYEEYRLEHEIRKAEEYVQELSDTITVVYNISKHMWYNMPLFPEECKIKGQNDHSGTRLLLCQK